jgi:ParB family chromosome partitioning protein
MNHAGTWDQLLGVTTAKLAGQGPVERRRLPLSHISPNADQPRKFFDAQALADLVGSVAVHGILQPILVRPHPQDPGRYQIVAGERRWLAAQQAGLTDVPVVVRPMTDQEALELGLVENVLREDITPLEEARALKRLIDAFGYSYARLGERLGKNKAYVDHRVRLLKMPDEIQDALERGVADNDGRIGRPFTPRHAGVVVQAPDADVRHQLIEAIFQEGLSVAQATDRLKSFMLPASSVELSVPSLLVQAGPVLLAAVAAVPDAVVVAADGLPAGLSEMPSRLVDRDVAVDTLAIHRLLSRAERGNGRASAKRLLAALQADRKLLMQLLDAAALDDADTSVPAPAGRLRA